MSRKTTLIGMTVAWALWALLLHLVNRYSKPGAAGFFLFAGISAGFLIMLCFLFFTRTER